MIPQPGDRWGFFVLTFTMFVGFAILWRALKIFLRLRQTPQTLAQWLPEIDSSALSIYAAFQVVAERVHAYKRLRAAAPLAVRPHFDRILRHFAEEESMLYDELALASHGVPLTMAPEAPWWHVARRVRFWLTQRQRTRRASELQGLREQLPLRPIFTEEVVSPSEPPPAMGIELVTSSDHSGGNRVERPLMRLPNSLGLVQGRLMRRLDN